MGFLVGIRDITRHLARVLRDVAKEREDRHGVIAVLLTQHAEIDSTRINSRWCTCFQAADA
ncbi:hypothetical protein D3C73_1350570 [compost metagenome]